MKKKLIAGYFVGFILLTLTTLASANTISVFYNSSFVDTTREGPNFTTALTNLGHTVSTFTGYDSAAFSSAIAGGDILAFPEMEIGNLYNALDGTTRTLLQNYVSGGGGIVQG